MSREIYNPTVLVAKDLHGKFIANTLVREVAPTAFKSHTKKHGNKAIYVDRSGNPKVVTYLPAGSVNNLFTYLKALNKLIDITGTKNQKISRFLIEYLKANVNYSLKHVNKMLKEYFEIDEPTVKSIIKQLSSNNIIKLKNNTITLIQHKNKPVNITNDDDNPNDEFKSYINDNMIYIEEEQKERKLKLIRQKKHQQLLNDAKYNPNIVEIDKDNLYPTVTADILNHMNIQKMNHEHHYTKNYIDSFLLLPYLLKYMHDNHRKSFVSHYKKDIPAILHKKMGCKLSKKDVFRGLDILSNYFDDTSILRGTRTNGKYYYRLRTNVLQLFWHKDNLQILLSGDRPLGIKYIYN